ncbi:MAG TPA: hypothetical protein VKW06_11090 [Candidatus Angelobacter sp.]|nr:hypothetical protein [Candidatus Angelobacter sp.]
MSKDVPSIDSAIRDLEELLRREQDNVKQVGQSMEKILEALERIKLSVGLASKAKRGNAGPLRYVGMTVIEAIETFLDTMGEPQSREAIVEDMIDGGAVLARMRPELEVHKSIDYWLLSEDEKRKKYRKRKIKILPPRLREHQDLTIGRASWPRQKHAAAS